METHEARPFDEHDDGADAIEAIQRAEQAERLAAVSDFDDPPRKRRRWLKVGGGLVLLLLVLVGVAPLVAGPLLKPVVEKRLAEAFDATVRIDRIALNWFAGPKIEGLKILDDALQKRADLSLRVDTPLFRLALAPRELGTLVVSGDLTLERRTDGSISPLPPPGPDAGGPIDLPDLSATLRAGALNIEWRDADRPPVRFAGVDGEVVYRPDRIAGGLRFSLEHPLSSAGVSVDLEASGLRVADGALAIESGTMSVEVEGEQADLDLDVLVSRGASGYRVTLAGEEASARLGGGVLAGLAPRLAGRVGEPVTVAEGRVFTLDALPSVVLRLTNAAATLDPRTFALSDTRFEAVIETGELKGTLDGAPWTIDPLLASAATRNLIDGVDVQGATAVTLDGARAGEISLLADGLRVLRPDGGFMANPAAMVAGSRTTLDVSGVSTAVVGPLLEPALAGTGLVLTRDLGPTVSAEFAVTSDAQAGQQAGLRFELESDNIAAAVGLRVDDGVLRTTGDASRISVRSASGYLTDALADAGVTVDEGAALDFRLGELAFDLGAQRDDAPLDLGALSGVVSVTVGRTAGRAIVDGAERPFQLRESEAEIDLRRLRDRATLAAGAAVEIDGRPAGTLNVSLSAADLLDAAGTLRSGVPTLSGEIALRNIRTALVGPWLDPFLAPLGLTPSRLLGESAELLIIGTPGEVEGQIGLQTTLRSGGLSGGGNLVLADRTIRSAGTVRFEHTNAGALVRDLLAGVVDDSVAPAAGGTLSIAIDRLAIGAQGLTALDAAVAVTGVTLAGGDGGATTVERLNAGVSLSAGARALELNGLASVAGSPMLLGGRLDFPAPAPDTDGAPLWWLNPTGRIDLAVPATAAALLAPQAAGVWRDVIALAVGDALEVALEAEAGTMTLSLSGSAQAASAVFVAQSTGRGLRFELGEAEVEITEDAIRQLRLARLAESGGASPPAGAAIDSEARLALNLGSFTLIDDGALSPAGTASLRLSATGSVRGLHEVTVLGSDGLPRRVREGSLGVRGLVVESELPVGAMLGAGTAPLRGTVRGAVVGQDGQPITQLAGAVDAELSAGALAGPVSLTIDLPSIDTALVDDSLRTDSFVSGLLGASASVSVELAGLANRGRLSDAGLTLMLASPRVELDGPMVFDIKPDRAQLASNTLLRHQLDPVFATRHGLHQPPGEERVRLAEPVELAVAIDRLTIARDGNPFRRGVFDVHASVAAPRLVVEQREEVEQGVDLATAAWQRSDLSPVAGEIVTDPETGARLRLSAAEGTERSLHAEVGVRGVLVGEPAFDLLVEGRRVPTGLIDGLADLGGGLAEVLGPYARVRLSVTDLSSSAGRANFSIVGDRASASLIGRIEQGVFRNEDPVVAQIDEIRPQLGARLSRAVPALGRVTKAREDGPATLTVSSLSFDLDQQPRLRGFDADFVVDIGTARFQASRAFGDVLIFARQKTDTEVGRQLKPMTGTVRQGVLAYEPLELPLGEFTLTSEGTYDLVTRRTDVLTAIPLGALSDRAMGQLNTGLGSAVSRLVPGLQRVTKVPWRVRGTPGNLTITPDIEAFTRQITRTVNPMNLIGNIFGL